jgi:6-phosphofructo-2-kinase
LVIALVGLPARGKSFVARKIDYYLNWSGCKCRIFNVGRYRREAYRNLIAEKHHREDEHDEASAHSHLDSSKNGSIDSSRDTKGACDANFFDASNAEAVELRERVASIALQDMLRWLDDEDGNGNAYDGTSITGGSVEGGGGASSTDVSRHGATSIIGAPKLVPLGENVSSERVAIFDATNSTKKRRQWILEECTSPIKRGPGKPTGVVFGTWNYRYCCSRK